MRSLPSAFFLASSWFWCIGGFFPVLLDHEFGQIALPVFFVFNVMGATLFGFMFSAENRVRFLTRFLPSAHAFSVLVAGYHLVFIVWVATLIDSALPVACYAIVTAGFYAVRRGLVTLSPVVFVITLGLIAYAVTLPAPAATPQPLSDGFGHYVAPLAFGFLLAPYFDLTFHRAYSESAQPRISFLIGIGGLFSVLLIGLFLAIPALTPLISGGDIAHPAVWVMVAVLVLQAGFTTAAHLREIETHTTVMTFLMRPAMIAAGLLCLFQVAVAQIAPDLGMRLGDLLYRSFLFAIGVLFPVILVFGGITRRAVITAGFLTPCYTLGFLIGGAFAPFLSVGMVGLAVMIWFSRQPVFSRS